MLNVLIIGGTGFLGRNLVEYIIKNLSCVVHVTGHSEYRTAMFRKRYPNIKVHLLSIENENSYMKIEDLIITYNINCIIHTAAMKHVNICQQNIVETLYTNVIFVQNLINMCKKWKVKDLIAISTDKANEPCNVYGMSKYMMQELILSNNYKIFQGVNFFWSDGSVLDIWFNQYKLNKPLTYTKLDSHRFYNKITDICKTVCSNIDSNNKVIITTEVYKISLKILLDAFCKYFNYYNTNKIDFSNFEKNIEKLINIPNKEIKIIELDMSGTIELIDESYKNIISI